jgi:hypothetical protein
MLSATLGSALEIEVTGADEREAVQAVQEFFGDQSASDSGDNPSGDSASDLSPESM